MSASTVLRTHRTESRALNISLWAAQIFIAVSFCLGGLMKLAMPIHQLADIWPWAGELSAVFVRLLGVIDFAGGAGVLLPALTRVKPGLTVLAALGCVLLQLCAMVFHGSRGELAALPVNVVFIAACGFILWGRWKRMPIHSRTGGR